MTKKLQMNQMKWHFLLSSQKNNQKDWNYKWFQDDINKNFESTHQTNIPIAM